MFRVLLERIQVFGNGLHMRGAIVIDNGNVQTTDILPLQAKGVDDLRGYDRISSRNSWAAAASRRSTSRRLVRLGANLRMAWANSSGVAANVNNRDDRRARRSATHPQGGRMRRIRMP